MLTPDEASWREVFEVWSQTVKTLGCRAIFQLPIPVDVKLEVPANILLLKRAPHRLIFPRCAMVIHHGGAGTTQASLLAGVPSVVVAHIADQPFWGHELERLGVGAKPMSRLKMSSERLVLAIQSVTQNPGIQKNAHAFSLEMNNEQGVSNAIRALMALACRS